MINRYQQHIQSSRLIRQNIFPSKPNKILDPWIFGYFNNPKASMSVESISNISGFRPIRSILRRLVSIPSISLQTYRGFRYRINSMNLNNMINFITSVKRFRYLEISINSISFNNYRAFRYRISQIDILSKSFISFFPAKPIFASFIIPSISYIVQRVMNFKSITIKSSVQTNINLQTSIQTELKFKVKVITYLEGVDNADI